MYKYRIVMYIQSGSVRLGADDPCDIRSSGIRPNCHPADEHVCGIIARRQVSIVEVSLEEIIMNNKPTLYIYTQFTHAKLKLIRLS